MWPAIGSRLVAQEFPILEIHLRHGTVEGLPIYWDQRQSVLLDVTGRLHIIDAAQIAHHRLTERVFQPESVRQARTRLHRELGQEYAIEQVGPYVIASPVAAQHRWQEHFIKLYGGFRRYAHLHQWKVRRPDFPLVVIEYSNQQEFLASARAEGAKLPPQAVGCYLPASNRCILFTHGPQQGGPSETMATVTHEAIHLLAFNTGIHSRTAENPMWLVEGLATMFEVPACYDLASAGRLTTEGRIHRYYRQLLQPWLSTPQRLDDALSDLIASDTMFTTATEDAYTLSWALAFYLCERRPEQLRNLIDRLQQRQFGAYLPTERHADFRTAVGIPVSQLSNELIRFYAGSTYLVRTAK